MTRDEILKRFEFDVMTGRLRSYTSAVGFIICPFERDNSEDVIFIAEIFSNLGFKNTNIWNVPMTIDGVNINITKKTYSYYQECFSGEKYTDNELPIYLYEYMERLGNEKQ